MSLNIQFLGHSAFLLSTATHKVLLDPFIEGNPKCPVTLSEALAWQPDAVLISHAHGDHWGNAPDFARAGVPIIGTAEIGYYCHKQGFENAVPMNIGGTYRASWGSVTLTPAWHSSSFPDGTYGGMPTGLVIRMGGTTVYFAGDTSRFSDMQLIAEYDLDLAILPIGDHFTMNPQEAGKCLDLLRPRAALPMHYGTFPPLVGKPEDFAAECERRGIQAYTPAPGETVTLG